MADNERSVWARFLNDIGDCGRWRTDSQLLTNIGEKIGYFDDGHSHSVEHVDLVMYAISRGYSLMRAVEDWDSPFVGALPQSRQDVSVLRGIQWRLFMAYNAFEIIYETLMSQRWASFSARADAFQRNCKLPAYSPTLASPGKDRAVLRRWLDESISSSDSEGDALLEFLGLNRGGDRTVFKLWLIGEQPVASWTEALTLSKALRNMSAHGALSASKVGELGLRPALETLTENLRDATYGAIRVLAQ